MRSRWWWEVFSDHTPASEDNTEGLIGTHYWEMDGGAFTLRSAVSGAMAGIQLVIAEIDADLYRAAREKHLLNGRRP